MDSSISYARFPVVRLMMFQLWGKCYWVNPPQNHWVYRKSDKFNQDLSADGPVNRWRFLRFTIMKFFDIN
jgi:hypothetical protein